MDNDKKLLEKMKLRIVRSFMWRKDVVLPLAKELDIYIEDCEKILMDNLDMSSLEALHATLESSKPQYYKEKLHVDLKLYWLSDVLEIITNEEGDRIKSNLVKEILKGKDYEDALEKGKKQILDLVLVE